MKRKTTEMNVDPTKNYKIVCSDTPGLFEVTDLGLVFGLVHMTAPASGVWMSIPEGADEWNSDIHGIEHPTAEAAADAVWGAYVKSNEFA